MFYKFHRSDGDRTNSHTYNVYPIHREDRGRCDRILTDKLTTNTMSTSMAYKTLRSDQTGRSAHSFVSCAGSLSTGTNKDNLCVLRVTTMA